MTFLKRWGFVFSFIGGFIFSSGVYAAKPADYIYSPIVEEGEREIDFKFGTERSKDSSVQGMSGASLGLGYGVNSWWFTEVYGKVQNEGGTTRFDAVEWENKFQLTETGKYPVDVGLLIELERPQLRSEGYELRYGLLMQSEWQKWQANLNILLERQYRVEAKSETAVGYQAQVKYRYQPQLEFGMQAISWLGSWNAMAPINERELKLGPAIFGKVKLESKHAIKYNAALLMGTTANSPGVTFRTQMEYEF